MVKSLQKVMVVTWNTTKLNELGVMMLFVQNRNDIVIKTIVAWNRNRVTIRSKNVFIVFSQLQNN